jgi:endonuclease/exonuclease/phosphatase family metal-dependent hydrolase
MLNYIAKQNLDIVSFQEFYYDNKDFLIDSVADALNLPYYFVTDSRFLHGFQHFGQAIFSKYPIRNSELVRFPNTTNMALYCDIEVRPNKIIRVFSNHMESYRFSQTDYQLMNGIKDKETHIDKIPGLVERLKLALIKRSYQAEKMASLINSSPYPVIVTGDFNDTPNSYTYHQMKGKLQDAFEASGRGFSNTYKGAFPSFRIDFILYSSELRTSNYERLDIDVSDHYPIISDFYFAKE